VRHFTSADFPSGSSPAKLDQVATSWREASTCIHLASALPRTSLTFVSQLAPKNPENEEAVVARRGGEGYLCNRGQPL